MTKKKQTKEHVYCVSLGRGITGELKTKDAKLPPTSPLDFCEHHRKYSELKHTRHLKCS